MTSYDKCKQYLQEEKGLSLSQSLLIIEGLKDFVDVDAMTINSLWAAFRCRCIIIQ